MDLLDRQLLFVTGKGGVGKTSVAAALGLLAARAGKRTLVCEMDGKGALGPALDTTVLDFEARRLDDHLFGMAMNTEDALREYLRLFVRVPLLARIGPLAGFAESLRRDRAAVEAALSTPWSTGPVEGKITKLKLIKRSMYGRAGIALLRQRLLAG